MLDRCIAGVFCHFFFTVNIVDSTNHFYEILNNTTFSCIVAPKVCQFNAKQSHVLAKCPAL